MPGQSPEQSGPAQTGGQPLRLQKEEGGLCRQRELSEGAEPWKVKGGCGQGFTFESMCDGSPVEGQKHSHIIV